MKVWGKGDNWIRLTPSLAVNFKKGPIFLHWCRHHGLNYSKFPRHELYGGIIRGSVRKT